MTFKDHFSELAETYSKYRPTYPSELFEYFSSICNDHQQAWDCGTGNGQAAISLAGYFENVLATDGSKVQLDKALRHPQIIYRIDSAEKVSLKDGSVDLVTVAAAVHWFNFEKFYMEVKRVLKPGGIIAVWGYHLFSISSDIDKILVKYYKEILNDYWPENFVYVDNRYQNLPFPFEEIPPPQFDMITEWDFNQVAGFLDSWSGTKIYLQKTGRHPLNEIWNDLLKAWGDEQQKRIIKWPLHMRVGKITK